MTKEQTTLRVVTGGISTDQLSRFGDNLKILMRQLGIREHESFKKGVSLSAVYTDSFEQGHTMRSDVITDLSWILLVRFAQGSLTILSLEVRIMFTLYTLGNSVTIMYQITDESLKVYVLTEVREGTSFQKLREITRWREVSSEEFDDTCQLRGRHTSKYAPVWLYAYSMQYPNARIFPIFSSFFVRIVRNVEHYSRYNFLFRNGSGRSQNVQTISVDELDENLS